MADSLVDGESHIDVKVTSSDDETSFEAEALPVVKNQTEPTESNTPPQTQAMISGIPDDFFNSTDNSNPGSGGANDKRNEGVDTTEAELTIDISEYETNPFLVNKDENGPDEGEESSPSCADPYLQFGGGTSPVQVCKGEVMDVAIMSRFDKAEAKSDPGLLASSSDNDNEATKALPIGPEHFENSIETSLLTKVKKSRHKSLTTKTRLFCFRKPSRKEHKIPLLHAMHGDPKQQCTSSNRDVATAPRRNPREKRKPARIHRFRMTELFFARARKQ